MLKDEKTRSRKVTFYLYVNKIQKKGFSDMKKKIIAAALTTVILALTSQTAFIYAENTENMKSFDISWNTLDKNCCLFDCNR